MIFFYNFEIQNVCSDVPRRFFPVRRDAAIAPRDGISCSGEPLTPIWAAHWAVTQVHGTTFVQLKGVRGEYIRHCSIYSFFVFRKTYFSSAFFEGPSCAKCSKQPDATFWKRISLYFLYEFMFVATLRFFGTPKWTSDRVF